MPLSTLLSISFIDLEEQIGENLKELDWSFAGFWMRHYAHWLTLKATMDNWESYNSHIRFSK